MKEQNKILNELEEFTSYRNHQTTKLWNYVMAATLFGWIVGVMTGIIIGMRIIKGGF